jgi:hypothetical protein
VDETPVIYAADLPIGPNSRKYLIRLLRSERYRAEMNAYSIRANLFHQPLLHALVRAGQDDVIDLEARFYGRLLDSLSLNDTGEFYE